MQEINRAVSSVGSEHYLDRVGVTGSSPVQLTDYKPCYSKRYHGFFICANCVLHENSRHTSHFHAVQVYLFLCLGGVFGIVIPIRIGLLHKLLSQNARSISIDIKMIGGKISKNHRLHREARYIAQLAVEMYAHQLHRPAVG